MHEKSQTRDTQESSLGLSRLVPHQCSTVSTTYAQGIKHPQRCVSDQCVRHLQAGDPCSTSYKGTKSPAHACPHFAQN